MGGSVVSPQQGGQVYYDPVKGQYYTQTQPTVFGQLFGSMGIPGIDSSGRSYIGSPFSNTNTGNFTTQNAGPANVYQPSYVSYQQPSSIPSPLPANNMPYDEMANIAAGMNLVNYNPSPTLSGLTGLSQLGIGVPTSAPKTPTTKG